MGYKMQNLCRVSLAIAFAVVGLPGSALADLACGMGSRYESFSLGAAEGSGNRESGSALHPDSQCYALGLQHGREGACGSEYGEGRRTALSGGAPPAGRCEDIGYKAGSAMLHYFVRTDSGWSGVSTSAKSTCREYYRKGRNGDPPVTPPDNIAIACYGFGTQDRGEGMSALSPSSATADRPSPALRRVEHGGGGTNVPIAVPATQ